MTSSIFYKQDQENIIETFKDEISVEEMSFLLNFLVNKISVGGLYDFFTIDNDNKIAGDINIHVTKIIQINQGDNFDYLISGTDEEDKELEIELSNTKFWTS